MWNRNMEIIVIMIKFWLWRFYLAFFSAEMLLVNSAVTTYVCVYLCIRVLVFVYVLRSSPENLSRVLKITSVCIHIVEHNSIQNVLLIEPPFGKYFMDCCCKICIPFCTKGLWIWYSNNLKAFLDHFNTRKKDIFNILNFIIKLNIFSSRATYVDIAIMFQQNMT